MALLLLAGCARHPKETPDERLRRQAAENARQLHQDVRAAGTEARRALANAGRETRDVVAGAREGWKEGAPSGKPHPGTVNINHASAVELAALPGVKADTAKRIVNGRPYASTAELVSRRLLSRAEYDRLQPRLAAN